MNRHYLRSQNTNIQEFILKSNTRRLSEKYSKISITDLFIIAKSWKQPKHPTTWEYLINDGVAIRRNSYDQLYFEK